MPVKRRVTRQITYDYGNLKIYAEEKGISYFSLKTLLSQGTQNAGVTKQLEDDGYGVLLHLDLIAIAKEQLESV